MNYLNKLYKGNEKLYFVFWFWFIFMIFNIRLLINNTIDFEIDFFETNFDILKNIFILLFYTFYTIFISIVLFKTCNKSTSISKIWKYLIHFFIFIHLFLATSTISLLITNKFYYDFIVKKQIEEIKNKLPIKLNNHMKFFNISKNDKDIYFLVKVENISFTKSMQE